jgi:hypothetical protein
MLKIEGKLTYSPMVTWTATGQNKKYCEKILLYVKHNKWNIFVLKGIVSRNLLKCFLYHSLDLKLQPLTEHVRLLLKFSFVSNVKIFVSLRSEFFL